MKPYDTYFTRSNTVLSIDKEGILSNVMANVIDSGIVVDESEFQSGYSVHFRTNTLEKGIRSVIV